MHTPSVMVVSTALAAFVYRLAWAGGPPALDVRLSCTAADRVSIAAPGTDKAHNDMQSCLEDERVAKDALVKTWASFSPAARTLCVGMNHTGGPPSYVELLTCLEVMRDASGP
jgi:hypothetical protein